MPRFSANHEGLSPIRMNDLSALLAQIGSPRVLVLGDLILDRYIWADAERVSPEAPSLVFRADHEETRLGGAASVAGLLKSLGARVALGGVTGDDLDGRVLANLLTEAAIDHSAVLHDPERCTTTKQRIMGRTAGRHAQQVVRLDREHRLPLDRASERSLLDRIIPRLEEFDVVCVADYGKGACTAGLLQTLLNASSGKQLAVLIDPARGADYRNYLGATLIKPNRWEAEKAAGLRISSLSDACNAARKLCRCYRFEAALVTLDADGMALVRQRRPPEVFSTKAKQIHDVTGAGDTVLAVVGLCRAAGAPWPETVQLANLAAGIQVERIGVAPITRTDIQVVLSAIHRSHGGCEKRKNIEEASRIAASCREIGKKVVFTNGCFDLLHVGHVRALQEAAALGDVLIVAVNSDLGVRQIKGTGRPIITEDDRVAILSALACVDYVLVFDDPTPCRLVDAVKPDVLVKGGDYSPEDLAGRETVASYGGKVCVTTLKKGVSTSRILSLIKERTGSGDV